MVPQEISAKYEVRGTLGSGAMGTVYDAFDRLIERRVAIKVVRKPAGGDAEAQEAAARFRREAQAAGRLAHPSIVAVYDYGENADSAWIVMELVEGGSLKAILDRGERLPVPQIVRLMEQILGALAYSHQRGVVHRDIKPANIMLTADGQVKIADFGIARLENSSMTQVGTLIGTPGYMAPEQFRGETVDARADIWAAGVVLYQLLTGEKPFEGGFSAVMHKALHTEPPPPSTLSVTAPRAFDAVLARAMAKRPEDRFPTAAAFAEAIRAAVGAPVGAAAPGTAATGHGGTDFGDVPLPFADAEATVVAGRGRDAAARPNTQAGGGTAQRPGGPASPPPGGNGGGGKRWALIGGGAGALAAAAAGAWFLVIEPEQRAAREAQARIEREAREAAERARAEQERLAAEAERARQEAEARRAREAAEAAAAERAAREEQERLAREAAERERLAREREAAEAAVRAAAERERQARDRVERDRLARERAVAEEAARAAAERERQAAAEAERQRLAALEAERQRQAAEAERQRQAEIERQRQAAAAAEAERQRQATAAAEAERRRQEALAAAEDERQRQAELERQRQAAEAERQRQAELERRRQEELERQRLALLQRPDFRAAAASALEAAPCSLLAAAADDNSLTLSGVLRRGGEGAIRRTLAERRIPPDRTQLRLQPFDGPYCGALDALRPVLAGPESAPLVSLVGRMPLVKGQLLRFDVAVPDWPAQLHVAYLMKSGEVFHMVPSQAQPAGARVRLGEPRAGFPGWEVDEPFGTDLMLVVASERPLFSASRPVVEPLDAYVAALSAALGTARREGWRVAVRPMVVETVER